MPTGPDPARLRRLWDRQSETFDRQMGRFERRLLGEHRPLVCGAAEGRVLEVAVGTGLNLPYYTAGVSLTGLDFSPAMLAQARARADALASPVALCQGDALALPFAGGSFDTVVCTFALCSIPDTARALSEMARVLRPGGSLLLLDHVSSTFWPLRAVQWLVDRVSVPLAGEHFHHRPLPQLADAGFEIVDSERSRLGAVERIRARRR
ncbi:class I SAM-dependent methyltransferase [Phytomonospora sp. NPDC050363]|uniref:class I SAM-dependent methyltransferase n=1 Tax=Phytomonospora sp. NPDC050363 TaxID=3155642 RepID=UPI0033ED49BC